MFLWWREKKKAGALWICIVLENDNLLGFLVGEKW